jgi:hypothetical protein
MPTHTPYATKTPAANEARTAHTSITKSLNGTFLHSFSCVYLRKINQSQGKVKSILTRKAAAAKRCFFKFLRKPIDY